MFGRIKVPTLPVWIPINTDKSDKHLGRWQVLCSSEGVECVCSVATLRYRVKCPDSEKLIKFSQLPAAAWRCLCDRENQLVLIREQQNSRTSFAKIATAVAVAEGGSGGGRSSSRMALGRWRDGLTDCFSASTQDTENTEKGHPLCPCCASDVVAFVNTKTVSGFALKRSAAVRAHYGGSL